MTRTDVAAIAVTYNAMPWIERCLESVAAHETIVVDHGSSDGTLELVRERFPRARLIEQENRGLGAGWNAGMRAATARCSAPSAGSRRCGAWRPSTCSSASWRRAPAP